MAEYIDRETALDEISKYGSIWMEYTNDMTAEEIADKALKAAKDSMKRIVRELPSAQPERLTDDDFETIRIHLSAYKERLCNQHRWKEAEEYQRIIDRFMSFASAQPEYKLDEWCTDCTEYDNEKHCCPRFNRVIRSAIEDSKLKQRWIPVSERLPEEGHDVLITKEPFKIKGCEHEVIKAKRSVDPRSGKIEWWSPEFGALTNKAVLAWMPLPEPYEEEKDG